MPKNWHPKKSNYYKQKLQSLFDLSLILDKIKCIEEQQLLMLHLTRRPCYSLSGNSNTQIVAPKIVNDSQIKLKFKQIQRESDQSWKPKIMHTQYYKPLLRPLQCNVNSPRCSHVCESKKSAAAATPQKIRIKQIRSKSTDQRWHVQKTESIDIQAQFNETKSLIRRFNRVKQKQVRFDQFT